MKISEMLLRENFYDVFFRTAHRYFYTQNFGLLTITKDPEASNLPLYSYSSLNAIISKKPSTHVVNYLLTEYNLSCSFWKRALAQFWVRLLTASRGLLASKTFFLKNASVDMRSFFILPCNRKIRFFCFAEDWVDVVLKEEFPDKFIRREVWFRSRFRHLDFVPDLQRYSRRCYREAILDGIPLARISDKVFKAKLLHEVENRLIGIQAKNFLLRESRSYIAFLKKKIEKHMQDVFFCSLFAQHCNRLNSAMGDFMQSLFELVRSTHLPLTGSHGDLQEGNVWYVKTTQSLVVIDWETFGKRSCWYDQFILLLSLRKKNTFIQNFSAFVEHGLPYKTFSDSPSLSIRNKGLEQRKLMAGIFLLEDFLWELDETKNLPQGLMGFGLKFYLHNFERLFALLS